MSKDDGGAVKRSWLERSMGAVEKVGNLLPHPFWLFASLSLVTVVLSAVLHGIGWSASYENVVDGAIQVTSAQVTNLMTFDTLAHYLTNFISIFVNYYPQSIKGESTNPLKIKDFSIINSYFVAYLSL